MSIHPSLAFSLKNRKTRSVLKRAEKIKYYQEKGLIWVGQSEAQPQPSGLKDRLSVFGLPKIKTLKTKFKKEKTEKAPAATAAGAGGTAKGAAAKPAAKGAAAKAAK